MADGEMDTDTDMTSERDVINDYKMAVVGRELGLEIGKWVWIGVSIIFSCDLVTSHKSLFAQAVLPLHS
jgi:hypothetical protein